MATFRRLVPSDIVIPRSYAQSNPTTPAFDEVIPHEYDITDQLADKAALQATLNAAGEANARAIAREQAARQARDRLNAQLSEIRARIERDRRSHGAADDEDLAEREAELARDLAAAEQAMEDAATQAAAARATIKAGMSAWLDPIQSPRAVSPEHLADIAAAGAEIERIDSASAAIKEAIAARQAARAAEAPAIRRGFPASWQARPSGKYPKTPPLSHPLPPRTMAPRPPIAPPWQD